LILKGRYCILPSHDFSKEFPMKKKMLKFSPELSDSLEKKLQAHGFGGKKQKMFGHEVFFLNGYMFTGANESGIFVHIGKDARDEALEKEAGVSPFEPMEGTVMREYLLLHKQVYSDDKQLKHWLDLSSQYLLSLPPKKKKK
jgi:TfoX/Sxy family transcriptional regulator of competence genes